MSTLDQLQGKLGERFGVLAQSDTHQLTVIAMNTDVAVGDLFLLPCRRGPDRFYIFRTSHYANIMNRTLEMNDVARNKLTMPDSYFSEDLSDEKLVELKGMVLGYAERLTSGEWSFHKPRRLPQHLSDVFHVNPLRPEVGEVVLELMQSQLGDSGLYVGDLLAGESALPGVPVFLPPIALSHHIGVFGRTGCGKSNLMMVLIRSILGHNQKVLIKEQKGPPLSIFAIDPHDEFRSWHSTTGGADGVRGIVFNYTEAERENLVAPFYYLTAKDTTSTQFERRVLLSRADIVPEDLVSISEFSEQQTSFSNQFYAQTGERWIGQLLQGDVEGEDEEGKERAADFLPSTVAAVQRRIGFLRYGHTRVFTRFDPDHGLPYDSALPDIICALEQGRVIVVDTTLMTEMEQFLLTTVVARVLFTLRRALRTAESYKRLAVEIRLALGNDEGQGQIGMRSLSEALVGRLDDGRLPYLRNDALTPLHELPLINVVVEEAPSILNPQRMKFGSVFRDISRQGRKFGIGLTVVSQQVSEIDQGVLTQINTEVTMSLGNDLERKEAIRNASSDLFGFERELQVMGRGQAILTLSSRDLPIPILTPNYDLLIFG